MPGVMIEKLTSCDGFVVFDLDQVETSVGVTRLAPKILVDGATWLARSLTYQFATFELKLGGASAGVNAGPDARDAAVDAFVREVAALVKSRRFLTEAGRGLTAADLVPLREADPRSPLYWTDAEGLWALGVAVSAAAALGGLDGRTVAIEGFDERGSTLASALAELGATIVAVASAAGSVADPAGLDRAELADAWGSGGAAAVAALRGDATPAGAVLAVAADVLVVGSKAGVVDDKVAPGVSAGLVVPSGPIPVTAKALAILRRADSVVLPDFVTTAGPLFGAFPPEGRTSEQLRQTVSRRLPDAITEVLAAEDGPLLASCRRAEAFLGTWQERLPFGRPLA